MSRWKAASIHLTISVTIGLIVGALLLLVWYPPPYFHAAGADVLVLLLVSVDIVLGPLLTLVVFKSGKKGLKFDLAVIALAQTFALVYGLSIVLRSRPVFVATAVDRFVMVSASDIDAEDLAEGSKPEFRTLSYLGPRIVGTQLPTAWQERNKLLFGAKGKDVEDFPKYYVDYEQAMPGLLKHAKPLTALDGRRGDEKTALDRAIGRSRHRASDIAWVPLAARKANLIMLLDKTTGEVIGPVAVNPWPR